MTREEKIDALQKAMEELGKSPAEALMALGIKGRICISNDCPLAKYFQRVVPGVIVGVREILEIEDDNEVPLVKLSGLCERFRSSFDCSEYPELIEEQEEEEEVDDYA
jgi:hypothetical protein